MKKTLNRKSAIERFIALFIKPKHVHPDFILPVGMVEIDSESKSFHGALGISDDRAEDLMNELHKKMLDRKKLHLMMVEMSKICKHPNELAFVCHHYGECTAMHIGKSLGFIHIQ